MTSYGSYGQERDEQRQKEIQKEYGRRKRFIRNSIIGALASIPVVIALAVYTIFMTSVTVEPGTEVVLVDRPWFFGHEGVRPEPLREGRKLIFRSTDYKVVRVTPYAIPSNFDDLASSDNVLLDFQSTTIVQVTDSVQLVQKFGDKWYENNLDSPYRSVVRDAVKAHSMSATMSSVATAQNMDVEITKTLMKLVEEKKIPVRIVEHSLGRAKPNTEVLTQMNLTAQEQQRKKTIIAATAAENAREEQERSKARADKAYRDAMNLSPESFIQLEIARRYSEACAESTCIITTGANPPGIVTK